MRQRASAPIRTFSIGFDGMRLYDERAHARRVARLFETEHTEELVQPRPVDDLARIVGAFDEPFADSSAIATYYLAAVTRRAVTVALSGTGADDLFGGYRRYASSAVRRALGGLPAWARRGLARGTGRLPSGRRSRVGQAVLYLQRATAADVDPAAWYASLMTVLDRDLLRQLAPGLPAERHPLASLLAEGERRAAVDRYLRTDFHTYLPDDLLVKEDRMTMVHGLEARVPFLDHDVMDFAWTLPAAAKVRGLRTKALLKRVAARWLPADVVERPKHGFALPVAEWLRGELRDMAAAALLDGQGGVLDRAAVRALWDCHQAGRDLGAQLWTLLVYRLWERDRAAGAAPWRAAATVGA
jgi:asparagine synthase (glutamine-hydrolysing)